MPHGWLALLVLFAAACGPASGETTSARPVPALSSPSAAATKAPTSSAAVPVPTDGGDASGLVDRARDEVAARAGVRPEAVQVVRVEAVDWPDTSLGCPQPGMLYAQVVTPGYLIVVEASGKRYEFHTDRQRLVLCRESAAE